MTRICSLPRSLPWCAAPVLASVVACGPAVSLETEGTTGGATEGTTDGSASGSGSGSSSTTDPTVDETADPDTGDEGSGIEIDLERSVDVLLVIDNSGSMGEEQG